MVALCWQLNTSVYYAGKNTQVCHHAGKMCVHYAGN